MNSASEDLCREDKCFDNEGTCGDLRGQGFTSHILRDTVAIGSAQFARALRVGAAGEDLRGIAGKRELRRRVSVQEVRHAVEEIRGEPWAALVGRHGDWARPAFLWAARRLCGCTLREIGAAAGGMNETAVGMAISRFEQRCARDRSLRKHRQILMQMWDVNGVLPKAPHVSSGTISADV
ncbi:MAG: hypothetical protein HQ592_05675 [Planctomycetes bacterium]|nr:hypothetical protein [Planctomycetota bacterium]